MPNQFYTKKFQKKKAFKATRRFRHNNNSTFGNNLTASLENLQLDPPLFDAENHHSQQQQQQQQQQQKSVHNFTDYKLSKSQTQLLNLGTTFVIPPAFNRKLLKQDVKNFKRKIRLKYYFSAQNTEESRQGPEAT